MATVRQMTEIVAEATGEPASTVRLISRALLDAEVLPKASGRRVPHVSGRDVAALLFGIYGSDTIRTAASAATTYSALRHNGAYVPDGAPDWFAREIEAKPKAGATLGDIMDGLMSSIAKPTQIITVGGEDFAVPIADVFVEICQSWPEVTFTFVADGKEVHMRFVEPGKDPMRWQSSRPRRVVTIPGFCLALIGIGLRPAEGEG